jgi:hypothetical protein
VKNVEPLKFINNNTSVNLKKKPKALRVAVAGGGGGRDPIIPPDEPDISNLHYFDEDFGSKFTNTNLKSFFVPSKDLEMAEIYNKSLSSDIYRNNNNNKWL